MERVSSAGGTWRTRLSNVAASAAIVAVACSVYGVAPYNQHQLGSLFGTTEFSFTGKNFLVASALAYIVLLSIYFLTAPEGGPSKSLRTVRIVSTWLRSPAALHRKGLSPEDRVALLTTLLKAFFAPLMAMSLMVFCMGALDQAGALIDGIGPLADLQSIFDRHGFWLLMQTILFVDVLIFTVGYLVELPVLGNRIRSVDPTLLGWAAALFCYPPFNGLSGAVLGSPRSDFPQFDNPTAHLLLNLAMLALMASYAWASVALGFKASNLTHRGIVARGPYGLVRHPAYTCKNIAWWIGSMPFVSAAFSHSALDGAQALASVAGWTSLYVLRALTEEDHLRGVDGEYAAYAGRVRHRFVPGLF